MCESLRFHISEKKILSKLWLMILFDINHYRGKKHYSLHPR